jgi:hypothetical protein
MVVSHLERETEEEGGQNASRQAAKPHVSLGRARRGFGEKICVILGKVEGEMRHFMVCIAVVTAAFVWTGSSLAATPTQIYRDFADNGRLDAKYSKADLDRALKDAVLQGYGDQNVTNGLPAAAGEAGETAGASGILPFTGLDLTLMALGGGALLAAGAGLRRLGKAKA